MQFIADCEVRDIRCLLILHGKGERSTPRALLKSYVSAWLPQLPAVMAIHSAERRHGGSGALYVLLRKSERKKRKTANGTRSDSANPPLATTPLARLHDGGQLYSGGVSIERPRACQVRGGIPSGTITRTIPCHIKSLNNISSRSTALATSPPSAAGIRQP